MFSSSLYTWHFTKSQLKCNTIVIIQLAQQAFDPNFVGTANMSSFDVVFLFGGSQIMGLTDHEDY